MSIVSINENLGAGALFAHVLGSWLRSALGKTVTGIFRPLFPSKPVVT